MARLSYGARKKMSSSDFALAGRRYPIEDAAHARNALARVSQHGDSAEKAEVRRKVARRYPGIQQAHHREGGSAHHGGHSTAHR